MKAVAWNRHGGKSNTDVMLLPASGQDINTLLLILKDCLKRSAEEIYVEGSTRAKAVEFCTRTLRMLHPADSSPEHFVEVE